MAFTDAKTKSSIFGDKAVAWGTYVNDGGSTGGDIDTGLHMCEALFLIKNGAAVGNSQAVNETFPVAGSAVTIVTDANESGYWFAIGDY